MSNQIIGREEELKIFRSFLSSKSSEFMALYGRRRIGKTFIVKQFFKEKNVTFFCITGEKDAPMQKQIEHFTQQISDTFYGGIQLGAGKNWDDTFNLLTKSIKIVKKSYRVVLFFDEFPWMATQNSKLLQSLDYYWNQYWSNDNRLKLIICGSSASWIIDNIVNNKGGLHNRLTRNLCLEPLNLHGTKAFLKARGIELNNQQIAEIYLAMGGVPYYLSKVEKGMSSTQIIESLAFKRRGFLLEEFDNLYSSLFKQADTFIDIVKIIASRRYGIGQRELLETLGKNAVGKGGLQKLNALKEAGFIIDFQLLFHKKKGLYYRLIDNYTLFYLYWISPIKDSLLKKSLTQGYWDKITMKPNWHSWSGLAFEAICYDHLPQISRALKLSPTAIPSTWRYAPKKGDNENGAQIDLLFDRDDGAITICEIKYCNKPFVITKDYAQKLRQKLEVFKRVTRTNKQLFIAFIASNGIKQNKYTQEIVNAVVTLNDLFKKE